MATTTANVTKTAPVNLTPRAISKVKEIMGQQNPVPAGLRVGVVGGGCSGFSYSMSFENAAGLMDKSYDFDGLKVLPDEIVHDLPGGEWRRIQRAEGYRHILVNGCITMRDGRPTNTHSGKLLRHGA